MSDHIRVPPGPKAMDDVDDCSPMHSICLSSPGSQRSPKAPLSPSSNNLRWAKKFKLIHRSQDHSLRPDTFVTRSRASAAYIPLVAIDSNAGKGECLSQTAKQWETIIKQAKVDDRVSGMMKAAKFFHFGHVLRDPKPAKPADAYVFIRRLSESQAREEVDGFPLPLKAYAADRRQMIRHRRRPDPAPAGSDDSELQQIVPNSTITPPSKLNHTSTAVHEVQGGSKMQPSNAQSSLVRKFKGGHDLNYLKFAAEEHLNDSELIKGIGRVPVNQQIPEPIRPVEDKPWELPTNAWALKDGKYLLQKMVSSDLTINNLTILQSATTLPSLEDPESLQLKWNGEREQTITVFKGREIKRVAFKDVIIIKYNRTESKLLFQFSQENSDKPEEMLLILLPVPDAVWQGLQTRCYSLIKGKPSKQRCDVEGADFFEDKAKALMSLRIKRAPMAPVQNRPVPQVANRGTAIRQKPKRPSRPMFQTRLNPTPKLEAPDTTPVKASRATQEPSSRLVTDRETQPNAHRESVQKRGATPDNLQAPNNDASDPSLNQSSSDIEIEIRTDNSGAIAKDSDIEVEDKTTTDVEQEVEDAAPAGVYYKSILRSGIPVPVRLNDLVVRLRSDKERDKGGKRDKLDLFDGPWRIVEFDLPQNTHGMKLSVETNKADGYGYSSWNESPSHFQFDKLEAKKMLKTKVRLGFPREAKAVRWVELSRLLPITKLDNVHNGKLHASCWGVAELTAFKVLQSEMESRNLEIFDPRHQALPAETGKAKPNETSGSAEDDMDEDTDEGTEEEGEQPMHVVELKSGIFVAIMEADPKAVDDGDSYLVEKLRSKRLRLFKLNSAEVRKSKLKTDEEDPWVKLLLKQEPQLAVNRVVISEYKVHWAGWPDEDDTWDIGKGNIAEGFIDEYHRLTDLLRDISIDTQVVNPRDMVFKDDLPKSGRGRQSGASRQSTGSLGTARRRSTASLTANSKMSNRGAKATQKYQDEDMFDQDEDIAMAKVIQASLDDAKAEKTKADLKALQKAMGVGAKQCRASGAPDTDIAAEDDGFMETDEQGGDDEDDIIMAEVDELEREIADTYLGGGGNDEGYEV